jgi:hypothetical protein
MYYNTEIFDNFKFHEMSIHYIYNNKIVNFWHNDYKIMYDTKHP